MLRPILAVFLLASMAYGAQTVDGRVVNTATGMGIANVNVMLFGDKSYGGRTDAEGRFRIENVPEGTYHPFYRARGFWTIPLTLNPSGLPPISITKGDPVHLEVKMQPVPKISGRVLDPEGKPVADATIWALENAAGCSEPSCFGLRATTKTGEKGEYTLDSFDAPGTWLISAIAPASLDPLPSGDPPIGWAQTFYPNVADPQIAARLQVRGGADLTSIDIKLAAAPVHKISGRVLDVHGDPAPKVTVMLDNGAGPPVRQDTGSDGKFAFRPVADGDWRVATLLQRQEATPWAGQALHVKDRDLENIELRLAEAFSVRSKVIWDAPEGVTAPDGVPDVVLEYQGMAGDVPMPVGVSDGESGITFEGAYPGLYKVTFLESPPAPFYLDSVRYGTEDAVNSEVSILSGDQPLAITFRYGGGSVGGSIENCGAAHVVLVPMDPALRNPGFLHDTMCGPSGQFEFAGVRPGEYYAIAVLAGDGVPWWGAALREDAVLRQAGKVTVRANEHSTADVPLVKR